MHKTFPILTLLFLSFLTACTDSVNKELYGTYVHSVNYGTIYSKFVLYPGKNYSFYARSCFELKRDSGSFSINRDTIYFTSFFKDRDTIKKLTNNSNLTGEKLIFQRNQLMYIITSIKPEYYFNNKKDVHDSMMRYDTVSWFKATKNIKQVH